MKKFLEILPFALIFLGSLGLLLNEFLFKAGTAVVLVFASANIIGLVLMLLSVRKRKTSN